MTHILINHLKIYFSRLQMEIQEALPRTLSAQDGIGITFSIMVGTGIFASPGVVLGSANGSVGLSFIIWFLSGMLCLLGGLCFAELGASIPTSGGPYKYLSVGIHPLAGFLLIWTGFWCLRTGAIAVVSIVFGRYLGSVLFSLDTNQEMDGDVRVKFLAIAAIIILSILNLYSIKWSIKLIKTFIIFKFIAVGFVLLLAIIGIQNSNIGLNIAKDNFTNLFIGDSPWTWQQFFSSIGTSTIFALWAYEGFSQINIVAEEVKDPGRNLPISIIVAIFGVTVTFILVNIAYLCILPSSQVITSKTVAVDMANTVAGNFGEVTMSLIISISALGSLNGSILTSPRILFAAARDQMFPFSRWVSKTKNDIPYVAIIVQSAAAVVIVIPGNFESLVRYFGFTAWIFYALVIIAMIRLRKILPNLDRPFKVNPFPIIPIVFILVSLFIVTTMFLGKPVASFYALLALLSGIPVYYMFFSKVKRANILDHKI